MLNFYQTRWPVHSWTNTTDYIKYVTKLLVLQMKNSSKQHKVCYNKLMLRTVTGMLKLSCIRANEDAHSVQFTPLIFVRGLETPHLKLSVQNVITMKNSSKQHKVCYSKLMLRTVTGMLKLSCIRANEDAHSVYNSLP